MKKVIAFTVLSILVLVLTACGASAGSSQSSSASSSTGSNGGSTGSATTAPVATAASGSSSTNSSGPGSNGTSTTGLSALQLAAGMLKLAGTSNAVTAQEATQLLPLWQSLQQAESAMAPQGGFQQGRSQGTPGAPQPNPTMMAMRQQVASQITAIENAMPPAQIQAITAMNLTGQDIFAAFQQAGITMGGPGRFGSNGGTSTPPQGTPPVAGTPGAFRGGFGQGGGRMGMGNFLPPSVVTGIIQYLQKTAGS